MSLSVVRGTLIVLLVIATAWSPTSGQDRSLMRIYETSENADGESAADRAVEESRKQAEQRYASALYAPLEGAVDPATYVVGPNDQFTVSIGGLEPIVSTVLVTADGSIVIPGVGRVEAAGRSLEDVEGAARSLLASSFRNVEVDIALARPREFWVHVTGAVPHPGRYLSRPVGRLEETLKQAFLLDGGGTSLANRFRPALRNVTIQHRDGTSESFDLVRYYRTGDVSANPYLRDGDAIIVRSYDPSRSSVFISGDIPFPGDYDFRPGDTILDLVAIGAGNVELEVDRVVRLTRRADDGSILTENYSLSSLHDGSASHTELQPLDQVNVPVTDRNTGVAAAEGMLRYSGQFPIEIGVTTLVDLINMAGGFREDALVRGAFLERDAAFGERAAFGNQGVPGRGQYEVITDSSAVLWRMRLGDFEYLSRHFLARWMKMDRRVSVDVARAMQPNAEPVYLQDGDRLFVPRDENSVYVIGEVGRPGRTPVVVGYGASDYVASVGGPGPRASDTYVIQAGTGAIHSSNAPVLSGDYVFVDRQGGEPSSLETERLRIMDEERETRTRQLLLQGLTAAAAVITTTILVIQQFNN